jgi:hypothetical protein
MSECELKRVTCTKCEGKGSLDVFRMGKWFGASENTCPMCDGDGDTDDAHQPIPGLRVTVSEDGVWMHFDAPSGKKGSIDIIALAERRGGICGQAMLEWANSIPDEKERTR